MLRCGGKYEYHLFSYKNGKWHTLTGSTEQFYFGLCGTLVQRILFLLIERRIEERQIDRLRQCL